MKRATVIAALGLAGLLLPVHTAAADPRGKITDRYATTYASHHLQESPTRAPSSLPPASRRDNVASVPDRREYKITPACKGNETSTVLDVRDCTFAMTACRTVANPDPRPLMFIWSRPRGSNGPWVYERETCVDPKIPGVVPPAVPTFGQIQTAFRRLPFSKPTVSIQPAHNKTLVNLPTFFEATWPGDERLQPGDVSAPIRLLSWTVQFRISSESYNFHYGDGTSSGPVTDRGGPYPDGAVRHTYTKAIRPANVFVDSQLTGEYRVNGGSWQTIDTVADLQNEPVTPLQVATAKARLYSN